MKPRILKILGINSFNEEQKIDFLKLMKNGIFGIFGDTGSGKSTIIDAITLALYGKMVRHKGKKGLGDFINLNRKNAKVEFEFSIKDGKDEIIYSVLRQFKKDKDGSIKSDISRLLKIGQEISIISDKKTEIDDIIEDIIGLNYDDFTRAVVLPQGKFSEFLMLENMDKRRMLERIFGLEKYGDILNKKINEKRNNSQTLIDNINQKMENYKDITQDEIKSKEEDLIKKEEDLKKTELDLKDISEKENTLKNCLNLKTEFIFYDKKSKELIGYKGVFEAMVIKLENSKKANLIKPYILEINGIENEKIRLNSQKIELNEKSKIYRFEYEKYLEEYKKAKKIFDEEKPKLEKLKGKIENCVVWEKERQNNLAEVNKIDEKIINAEKTKDLHNEKLEKTKEQITNLELQISEIDNFKRANKIDIGFKINLQNGIRLLDNINIYEDKIKDLRKVLNSNKENILKYEAETKKNLEKINSFHINIFEILTTNKIRIEEEILKNEKERLKIEQDILCTEDKIKTLEIQMKIQENKEVINELVKTLEKGKPCPICGGKEHPNPAKILMDTLLKNLQNTINGLKNDIKAFEKNKVSIGNYNLILNKYLQDIEVYIEKYRLNIGFSDGIYIEKFVLKNEDIFEKIGSINTCILELKEKNTKFYANIENAKIIIKEGEQEKNNFDAKVKKLRQEIYDLEIITGISDFYAEYQEISEMEDIIYKKDSELSISRMELNNILPNMEKLKNEFLKTEREIISMVASKKEKQSVIEELTNKIEINSIRKDFNKFLEEVTLEIGFIISQESATHSKYENYFIELNNVEKEFEKIKAEVQLTEKTFYKKREDLDRLLKEQGLEEREVLKLVLSKEDEEKTEKKIESYKTKSEDYKTNIARIKRHFSALNYEVKDILDVDTSDLEKEYQIILKIREDMGAESKSILENITKLKIEIEEDEKIIASTKILKKELESELKKFSILEELTKLNKGGVFVEYIANRQLKHIVLDASGRFFSMSGSKYSLELISSEFVIKDHYNGGVYRSPRSLSGGEVFMASLSLALALSSKIQLKNKAPLEVFFLDEGFGTLDRNVLDTVIGTLEQLHTSSMAVGIITHVEEIKSRIQNKINISDNDGNYMGANIILE